MMAANAKSNKSLLAQLQSIIANNRDEEIVRTNTVNIES